MTSATNEQTANKTPQTKTHSTKESPATFDLQESNVKFWILVDQHFKDIIQAGQSAFKLNMLINKIVVAIGIILIGSSILYSWVNGANPWSTLTTGIGMGSFVIVFFINPQSNINKAVASLASVGVIYKAHKHEFEAIISAISPLYDEGGIINNSDKLKDLIEVLEKSTTHYVDLLNTHLEIFGAVQQQQNVDKNKDK